MVVYLHAGGFTFGDKADDESMLAWLCRKGYVAAGINYTLRTDTNNASVLLESNEIKAAIPQMIDAAKNQGYVPPPTAPVPRPVHCNGRCRLRGRLPRNSDTA